MKLKYIFVSCLSFMAVSCNDSFLERLPQDQLSDESYWSDMEDAVKYSANLYSFMTQPGNHMVMLDAYTDNAVPVHVGAEQGEISACAATSTNPHFQQVWSDAYNGIRRCNIFMANIERIQMNEEKRNELIGEVEFLRAYFHATLLKFFGGVPILTRALELNEPIPARNTEEEVYKFVMDECDKAIAKLPVSRSSKNELGRANKGAAMALKAHISYLMGKYDIAAKSAKEVIDLGVYKLYPDYKGLFEKANENNCEVIFDHQYMDNAIDQWETGSWIDQFFAPVMFGGWEALSPSQDLVDAYECVDGKSIDESPLYDPAKPYENRDPRLAASILWHGSQFAGMTFDVSNMGDGNHTRTGYSIRKCVDETNYGCNYWGALNYILFRYAEMLLIYAEGVNYTDGPTAEVYDAVNQVRARVNLPELPEKLTKEQMRDAIRHERRVEFTFEGIHLFETRSWKTTEACVNKPVYGRNAKGEKVHVETRKFNPAKDYLWGIPQKEIDLSKGSLKYNPGY